LVLEILKKIVGFVGILKVPIEVGVNATDIREFVVIDARNSNLILDIRRSK
jgi:hypothetical protein